MVLVLVSDVVQEIELPFGGNKDRKVGNYSVCLSFIAKRPI